MVILKDDSRTYKRIESKYMYGKLKTWKELIKMNLHGQDVPYNINYNVTAVLKIDSIYKQSKNYHPQVYVEECKYTDAESQQCSMFSDSDDDGYFELKKETSTGA